MRAALLEEQGQPLVICDDIEIAGPGPGQVLVRVSHCGLCHSDLSLADGAFPVLLPIILGHEAAGRVERVGEGVKSPSVGDQVVLTPCPPCGLCYWCVRAQPSLCVDTVGMQTSTFPDGSTGLSRKGETVYRGVNLAAFGEYVVTPASGAVKVDEDIPLDVACVIGCAVQTGVGAVLNTAGVVEGATVLVLGLGGIGLSVVQGAVLASASRIIASDPNPARRQKAGELGATDLIDPSSEDMGARVMELTAGIGADYAFEAAGHAPLVTEAYAALRNGGTAVAVGAAPIEQNIELGTAALFTLSEKTLKGCVLGSSHAQLEIPRLVSLWQRGRLDLEALITKRRPLAEINEAMKDLRAGRGVRTVLEI